MSCPKCGGDLVGDGYTSVIHCEDAEEEDYWHNAPDDGPVYCNFEEDE